MSQVESRRALLLGALGGLAAAVAGALGRPAPVWAASSVMLDTTNTATAQTGITSPQTTGNSAVLAAYSTAPSARVYALYGQAASATGFGVYSFATGNGVGAYGRANSQGVGVMGSADNDEPEITQRGIGVLGVGGTVGVAGRTALDGGVGLVGQSDGAKSTGVRAVSNLGTALQAETITGSGIKVRGSASGTTAIQALASFNVPVPRANTAVHAYANAFTGAVAVYADSPSGTALAAVSSAGTALQVTGKARFTRSGKASLAANKTSVDLDLGSLGGISSASLCFANLAIYKSGVWVTAVRPNWPTAGKLRIYINKVASTTSSTAISWLVLEG